MGDLLRPPELESSKLVVNALLSTNWSCQLQLELILFSSEPLRIEKPRNISDLLQVFQDPTPSHTSDLREENSKLPNVYEHSLLLPKRHHHPAFIFCLSTCTTLGQDSARTNIYG